jgi:hypothetical protein
MAALPRQFVTGIDLNGNQIINAGFEKRSTAPATSFIGQIYEDTSVTPSMTKKWNGTAWIQFDGGAPAGGFTPQGSIDGSTNPAFPANPAEGNQWLITTPGTVGGLPVKAGDTLTYVNGGFQVTPGNIVAATPTQPGFIQIATPAQIAAGTDNTTAVTPLGLATALQTRTRKFTVIFTGNGTTTDFVANHQLNTDDVVESLKGVTNKAKVEASVVYTDANNMTFAFAVPPANGVQYKATIIG